MRKEEGRVKREGKEEDAQGTKLVLGGWGQLMRGFALLSWHEEWIVREVENVERWTGIYSTKVRYRIVQ